MDDIAELYTTPECPHCEAARSDFEWRGVSFVEYNVEQDAEALRRMLQLTGGSCTVPVIVEPPHPLRIGWMGTGSWTPAFAFREPQRPSGEELSMLNIALG